MSHNPHESLPAPAADEVERAARAYADKYWPHEDEWAAAFDAYCAAIAALAAKGQDDGR